MTSLQRLRMLPSIRLVLHGARALLACILLTWGLVHAVEPATPASSLRASGLAEAWADPAQHEARLGVRASTWQPKAGEAKAPGRWLCFKHPFPPADAPSPMELEPDLPDYALPAAESARCLPPLAAWTKPPAAAIDIAPQQGLLRPPDLG